MKLSWVTFRVHDLEKSIAFYTQSLGMEIAARFGDENHPIVMLGKDDAAKVELIGEPDSYRAGSRCVSQAAAGKCLE